MNNIIVNADDLGMTPGTNKAIFEGYDKGKITHASIMSNCDYFENAILGLKDREELKIGIHLNLTYGKALHSCLFYTNKQGIFNLGYLSIIRKSIFHKDFLSEVKKEFELQILRVHDLGITISHLDSHRHIHLIPEIYKIVIDLAEKYDISKVRLINEDFFNSLSLSKRYNFILNGGLIKFILLKYFTKINITRANLYGDIKFYSILYTGVISKDILEKLEKSKDYYEVMVHPGLIDMDKKVFFYDENEKDYRLSKDRKKELDAIL